MKARHPGSHFWARPSGAPPRVIGHRGAARPAPPGAPRAPVENTLEAFAEAIAQGASAVELDVRVAASGEVVVFHDPSLERLTGGRDLRAVAALGAADLARVELGGGERVALLEGVLASVRPGGTGVNIEMKRDVPDRVAVVRATASLLRAWDPSHPRIVSSFDPAMLALHSVLAPKVPVALLVHRSSYHDAMLALGPLALRPLAVHIERTIATPERIERLRRRGFVVNVWTVNDVAEAKVLSALGVDGLITDLPGVIRAALG